MSVERNPLSSSSHSTSSRGRKGKSTGKSNRRKSCSLSPLKSRSHHDRSTSDRTSSDRTTNASLKRISLSRSFSDNISSPTKFDRNLLLPSVEKENTHDSSLSDLMLPPLAMYADHTTTTTTMNGKNAPCPISTEAHWGKKTPTRGRSPPKESWPTQEKLEEQPRQPKDEAPAIKSPKKSKTKLTDKLKSSSSSPPKTPLMDIIATSNHSRRSERSASSSRSSANKSTRSSKIRSKDPITPMKKKKQGLRRSLSLPNPKSPRPRKNMLDTDSDTDSSVHSTRSAISNKSHNLSRRKQSSASPPLSLSPLSRKKKKHAQSESRKRDAIRKAMVLPISYTAGLVGSTAGLVGSATSTTAKTISKGTHKALDMAGSATQATAKSITKGTSTTLNYAGAATHATAKTISMGTHAAVGMAGAATQATAKSITSGTQKAGKAMSNMMIMTSKSDRDHHRRRHTPTTTPLPPPPSSFYATLSSSQTTMGLLPKLSKPESKLRRAVSHDPPPNPQPNALGGRSRTVGHKPVTSQSTNAAPSKEDAFFYDWSHHLENGKKKQRRKSHSLDPVKSKAWVGHDDNNKKAKDDGAPFYHWESHLQKKEKKKSNQQDDDDDDDDSVEGPSDYNPVGSLGKREPSTRLHVSTSEAPRTTKAKEDSLLDGNANKDKAKNNPIVVSVEDDTNNNHEVVKAEVLDGNVQEEEEILSLIHI